MNFCGCSICCPKSIDGNVCDITRFGIVMGNHVNGCGKELTPKQLGVD